MAGRRRRVLLAAILGVCLLGSCTSPPARSHAGTTSSADPTTQEVGSAPPGLPPGYRLAFSDDFTSGRLDPSKWTTCYSWAGPSGCTNFGNPELEWYVGSQAQVDHGALHLVATTSTVSGLGPSGQAATYNYTSGMVSTAGRLEFTYGYVEVRAKLAGGRGLWPALWLIPTSTEPKGEIDLVELLGQSPTVARLRYHWRSSSGLDQQLGHDVTGPDWTAGWHTYAVLWEPGLLIWYLDGVREWIATASVPNWPVYFVANLAVGGWAGPPDGTTPFPASLDVASVRIWQRPS